MRMSVTPPPRETIDWMHPFKYDISTFFNDRILCIYWVGQSGRWTWPIIIDGVDEVKNDTYDSNLPIDDTAATTDGYYMHIGIIYFLLLITMSGTTAKGNDKVPITF
jgi:hypothetical protein